MLQFHRSTISDLSSLRSPSGSTLACCSSASDLDLRQMLLIWFLDVSADRCLLWHAGLAMSTYEGSERLKDFFVVTSLSSDKQGAVYISTMEARKVG